MVGENADLIRRDWQQPNMQAWVWEDGNTNVLWNIGISARGANVATVAVDEDILPEDGCSTKVDGAKIAAAAQSQAARLMGKRHVF